MKVWILRKSENIKKKVPGAATGAAPGFAIGLGINVGKVCKNDVTGRENLRKPQIAAYIAKRMGKQEKPMPRFREPLWSIQSVSNLQPP